MPGPQDGTTFSLKIVSLLISAFGLQSAQTAFKIHEHLIGVLPSFNLLSPFLRESHLCSKEQR